MCRKLVVLGATLLMFGCMALAADKAAFMGVVSDSHCGAKHSTAGDDAAACAGNASRAGQLTCWLLRRGKSTSWTTRINSRNVPGNR